MYYLDQKNFDIINNKNKKGQTALHLAILTNGNSDIIKNLLKKGIKVDIKDNNNLSALDITSQDSKYETIKKLILDYTKTNCLGLNFHIYLSFIFTNYLLQFTFISIFR